MGQTDFDVGKSILRAIGKAGPEKLYFFGPWNGKYLSQDFLTSEI